MLIGMSAIFTHFIGNVVVTRAVYVADCMVFYALGLGAGLLVTFLTTFMTSLVVVFFS